MTMQSSEYDNFKMLLEQSMSDITLEKGAVITATIVDIKPDRVTLNSGLKSDSVLSITEFGEQPIEIGQQVEVVVETVENGYGETCLSREKAVRRRAWLELQKKCDDNESVHGILTERVKGGFTVQIGTIKAFLPGSLVDVKPVRDPSYLEGKELEFKIVKMDERRNNIVVSRRAVMESENSADKQARLSELKEGQELVGIVKNITDYGAFIDLGGVDGLLHITDMAWKRVKHPSEVLTVGDEQRVKVLKFEAEKSRVSLGIKQLGEDPWVNIAGRYPKGARLNGVVTNVTDYGCFVELEEGVEGLVHMSEMDWTNKNIQPNKKVKVGDHLEVMVLDIDESRRRISLGLKQCQDNPWDTFSSQYKKDDRITGKIRSITDFGVFVGLVGNIDGLVHLSDLSWDDEKGDIAVQKYSKGDEVEVILSVDPERERISLGIKQLENNPVAEFYNAHVDNKNQLFSAEVVAVERGMARVKVESNSLEVIGILKSADYSYDRIDNLADEISVGDHIDVKLLWLNNQGSDIRFSHKIYSDLQGDKNSDDTSSDGTLGDIFKQNDIDRS